MKYLEHIVSAMQLRKLPVEGVVAQCCNPLTLKPGQSGGVSSIPGTTPSHERYDKGVWTQLDPLYFCDPSAWR